MRWTEVPRDQLRRAESLGRIAARGQLGHDSCPFEANGTPEQRVLARRWMHAYIGAGGRVDGIEDQGDEDGGDMPNKEVAGRGGAKRWRTITLPSGRKVTVAVVRKPGPRGGHTVAETKESK